MTSNNKKHSRAVVIGIDGVPFSFLNAQMRAGRFPNFQQLLVEGDLARMNSIIPTVSSVAWTSIMTGRNPAGHNIFGFIDRKPDPISMFIPTAADRRAPALWDILGRHGKYCVVMNVPCTYPPRPLNGKMVSCFLATDLKKATYPPELAATLERFGYVIDVDPWKGRQNKSAFMDDLFTALDRRLQATIHLMENEPWDLFVSHVMETDRLMHFFWREWESGHPEFAPRFDEFFGRVDSFLGEIRTRLPRDAALVILSDHGFCGLKKEVFVNRALKDAGLLSFTTDAPKELSHIAPESRAYSLIPGRVFINLKGREQMGTVAPGAEYESARDQVIEVLMDMKDPDDGSQIVEKVYRREEIYSGAFFASAPDLTAVPRDGYDLKGALLKDKLTGNSEITGMHTFHDALLYATGQVLDKPGLSVVDVLPSILSLYGITEPGLDGKSCF